MHGETPSTHTESPGMRLHGEHCMRTLTYFEHPVEGGKLESFYRQYSSCMVYR